MTVAVRMTAGQRAQLARAIEHARAEQEREAALRSREARHESEELVALACRLLPHVCMESVMDRVEQAMSVARMVLDARGAA